MEFSFLPDSKKNTLENMASGLGIGAVAMLSALGLNDLRKLVYDKMYKKVKNEVYKEGLEDYAYFDIGVEKAASALGKEYWYGVSAFTGALAAKYLYDYLREKENEVSLRNQLDDIYMQKRINIQKKIQNDENSNGIDDRIEFKKDAAINDMLEGLFEEDPNIIMAMEKRAAVFLPSLGAGILANLPLALTVAAGSLGGYFLKDELGEATGMLTGALKAAPATFGALSGLGAYTAWKAMQRLLDPKHSYSDPLNPPTLVFLPEKKKTKDVELASMDDYIEKIGQWYTPEGMAESMINSGDYFNRKEKGLLTPKGWSSGKAPNIFSVATSPEWATTQAAQNVWDSPNMQKLKGGIAGGIAGLTTLGVGSLGLGLKNMYDQKGTQNSIKQVGEEVKGIKRELGNWGKPDMFSKVFDKDWKQDDLSRHVKQQSSWGNYG